MYLYLNHFAIHLKHCTSPILQFLKICLKKKKRWWSASASEVSLSGWLPASIRSTVFPLSRSEFLFSLHLLLIMKAHYLTKVLHMFVWNGQQSKSLPGEDEVRSVQLWPKDYLAYPGTDIRTQHSLVPSLNPIWEVTLIISRPTHSQRPKKLKEEC